MTCPSGLGGGGQNGVKKENLGGNYKKMGVFCTGCAGTIVGADSGVVVIQHLGFGVVTVAVHEQNGPVSIRTPCPRRLGGSNRVGAVSCHALHIPR